MFASTSAFLGRTLPRRAGAAATSSVGRRRSPTFLLLGPLGQGAAAISATARRLLAPRGPGGKRPGGAGSKRLRPVGATAEGGEGGPEILRDFGGEGGGEDGNGSGLVGAGGDVPADKVVPIELNTELSTSFMQYAMSTILGRALPDARDGLKPVHRRILYAMHVLNLQPESGYRKCARVVGEVLGE